MLFNYKAVDTSGGVLTGSIDAINIEVAITSLQRRGLTISTIVPQGAGSVLTRNIGFFQRVKGKDIVILSRQISTLFEAQISALRIFRLLASEASQPLLQQTLLLVADDIQAGSSISKAIAKHPNIFSTFYVNMVKAGEEAGKIDHTFAFLADYLERTYEVSSKAKNALIYPVFVIFTFIAVMVLMLVTVIPSVSSVLAQADQQLPIYTQAILGLSHFFVRFGWFLLIVVIAVSLALWQYVKTPQGRYAYSDFKIKVPYVGDLYRKLYFSRISDNLHTMLLSAIPIVKSLEITSEVVDNAVFERALNDAAEGVKNGSSIADSFAQSPVFPGIMIQMIRVGEESGELGNILETLGRFYRREVANAVDTLVALIEPALIIMLGLGVGFLLAAVLIPIYTLAGAM